MRSYENHSKELFLAIRERYSEEGSVKIAQEFGLTPKEVWEYAAQMKIINTGKKIDWTNKKLEELRERYPLEDNGVLAKYFGCSKKALVMKASSEGLKKHEECNDMRYYDNAIKKLSKNMKGERREIKTGTVIIDGSVTVHISNASFIGAHGR